MSFLDKIKGKGKADGADLSLDGVMALDAPMHDETTPAAADRRANAATAHMDSSIITEAAPSEVADFADTRMPPGEGLGSGTGLPLIGEKPVGTQQKILFAMVAIGLVGLTATAVYSINSATKGAAQVGASGQALMQSQRLAKSVSQALIGSASAFPEVKESTEVLARNVRGLATGEGELAAAPGSVQVELTPLIPLVDAAEKNAKTVLGQQQILTQVGQALRAVFAARQDDGVEVLRIALCGHQALPPSGGTTLVVRQLRRPVVERLDHRFRQRSARTGDRDRLR